jgi:CubicO group peptidase (beta-lactamase class C family)
MTMSRRARTLALAALLPAALGARSSQGQSVASHPRVQEAIAAYEKWLDGERAFRRIPGVSSALVIDQDVIWKGASGYADLERKAPATPTTIYSVCSISKLFTSIAALQLRDEGRLRLDDPVSKHLPWFTPRTRFPDDGAITVEGLLTHASGLQPELADTLWLEPNMAFPTHDELVKGVAGREVSYRPERYFQYSNLGFTLAGAVVAAAAGQPYDDYIRARILTPLGLTSTWTELPPAERGKRLATGYSGIDRDGNRHAMPFYQTKAMAPAAGFASTPLDLATFASWQFRLLERGGREILTAPTLREMQRVHFTDPGWTTTWGLGFSVWRHGNKTFVGHGGSCPGYRTQLLLQLDDRVATIFMANASGVDTGKFARGMHGLVAPALKEAAGGRDDGPADPAADTSSGGTDLDRYLGSYDSFPWGGETAVVRWKDGLALLSLPTDNPVRALSRLEHVSGHTFRRIRTDDQPGETIAFQVDADGRSTALLRFENRYPRIR